ncbi:hypothetical protein RchiOBHm_Chr6g0310031 [Rosa chinensis]|uniref:Uncharacterized protein n=1 Tax=Rosa chinensis TaxID=74649 RepID=A0A2P6Q116_ROSCH|nr:hypothetical protein RchiOBHm_Chr6g0310031 [Rosa chinensis]
MSTSFRANVPFSWEKKPGTSKLKPSDSSDRRSLDHYFTTTTSSLKLIPPPARLSSQISISSTAGNRQTRGGPCLCSSVDVQPSVATFRNPFGLTGDASPTTAKNNRLQEDPFLAAFIKCTQMHGSRVTNSGKSYAADSRHYAAARFSAGKKTTLFSMFTSSFSCKYSSAVRDDNIVVARPRKSPR